MLENRGIYIKYCFKFQSFKAVFLLFDFDSKYNTDIYKSVKVSTGTVMRNPEVLKFVPGYLKTKKLCQHAVKKLPFVLRYVPDRYKTQQMCNKAILENEET